MDRRRLAGVPLISTLILSGILILAFSNSVLAQVRLTQTQYERDETIVVNITNGSPTAKIAQILLKRGNRNFKLQQATYNGGANPAVATGIVPRSLELGSYTLHIYLTGQEPINVGKVSIVPAGSPAVHLNAFSPDATYDIKKAYFPDESSAIATEQTVVHYRLNGSELDGETSPIRIDGMRPQPAILWSGCNNLPPTADAKHAAGVLQVYGKVQTQNSLELCRVPSGSTVSLARLDADIQKDESDVEKIFIFKATQGKEAAVVDVVLQGSGFQYDNPDDNAIWINRTLTPVKWDGCRGLSAGNEHAPIERIVHGEIRSNDQIRLCMVPVPENGELLIATGFGDTPSEPQMFRVFAMTRTRVGTYAALTAAILALIPLAVLAWAKKSYMIEGQRFRFSMLFIDPQTDTYSLANFQFYMWSFAAFFGYAYLFISRLKVQYQGWPDVPGTLPAIIAISAGTAVGSQAITGAKGSKGAGDEHPSIADFLTSGGAVAPDRVQMFLWTILGVGAFFTAVLQLEPGRIADLPEVPERLMYLMGLSAIGYLGGKMARKAGPVINEVSITPGESDDSIARANTPVFSPDFMTALMQAEPALNAIAAPASSRAKTAVDALRKAIDSAKASHTVLEMNKLIADLSQLRTTAETAAEGAAEDVKTKSATPEDANAAQQAAAALQDFAADITTAISNASAAAMESATVEPLIARTIELRGTNLAPDAMLQIDKADLPFRMLMVNKDNQKAPEVMVRDDLTPTFAKVLRLAIDPAQLGESDVAQVRRWFGTNGRHSFVITNPDGQKAELSFNLPPGEGQK